MSAAGSNEEFGEYVRANKEEEKIGSYAEYSS